MSVPCVEMGGVGSGKINLLIFNIYILNAGSYTLMRATETTTTTTNNNNINNSSNNKNIIQYVRFASYSISRVLCAHVYLSTRIHPAVTFRFRNDDWKSCRCVAQSITPNHCRSAGHHAHRSVKLTYFCLYYYLFFFSR